MQFQQTICLLLLFWALIWVAIRAKADPQPTFAVRLTNPGVKFFSSIGHKLVNKELPKTKFPPISLLINSGPGSGQVDVSDLQIRERSFQSPKFQFTLVPPESIKFISTDGFIPVSGQWSAYYWLAGIKFYTSGWVQLEADGIQSTISLAISHWKGKPQLDLISCQADISQIDVQIGGGVIPWLVNLFRSSLSAALKQAVHDQFCLTAKTSLLAQLNLLLLSLPTTLTLGDSLFLQYSFDNDTEVTNSYIQSMAFANLVVQNDSEKCPFGPKSPMPLSPSIQQCMVSVWLHGSVMNCVLWSIHRANILQMTISPGFDGGKFAKFLQTSCHIYQICIGRFFPQLSRQFPGQHVDFHFLSASPPNAKFVDSKNATLNLTAQFYVDFHISPWKSHTLALARLEMNATADFEPILDGRKLKGKLGSLEVKFVELSSSIGNFSAKFLNTFALLAKPIIEVAIQSSLRTGFPLPTIDGIELANGSQLTGLVESQQLRLDSNLEYANLAKIGLWNGKKLRRKHFN